MKKIKKILRWFLLSVSSILLLVVIYLITERVLSRKTVEEVPQDKPKNIVAYISSNGAHTDIILPIKTKFIDWSKLFPYENTLGGYKDYNYVAIGWGDKGFYLETPEWSDLKISTALNAAIGYGSTALHITYYRSITEDELTKKTKISESQYEKLIEYIRKSIKESENREPILIVTDAQYGNNDAFYEAKGSYNISFTCNTWVNNALKYSGMKACKWVAFDKGLLYQYDN